MKVVVVLFMIWSHGYAKNVLGSQDLLKILPGQDITSGGGNLEIFTLDVLVQYHCDAINLVEMSSNV